MLQIQIMVHIVIISLSEKSFPRLIYDIEKQKIIKRGDFMSQNLIPLYALPTGCIGKVRKLTATGGARRRMLDLGLVLDTTVESLRKSPGGDPTAYTIRGAVIALRLEESCKIFVEQVE
jgi:ferrous iron transport protein A